MEKHEFKEWASYIVVIQYPNYGRCICYKCDDMNEVFDAFADDLSIFVKYYQEDDYELNQLVEDYLDGDFSEWESIEQTVEGHNVKDFETVKYLYDCLFDDIFGMSAYVVDGYGKVVFKL